MEEGKLELSSKEGIKVSAPVELERMSNFIKSVLSDYNPSVIELNSIGHPILIHILKYCQIVDFNPIVPFPKYIPPAYYPNQFHKLVVLDDERQFILDQPLPILIELMKAADYMDIPRLLHLCSLKIAFDFRGSEKEIEEKYSTSLELDEETEEHLKNKYPWAMNPSQWRLNQLKLAEIEDKQKKVIDQLIKENKIKNKPKIN